MTLDSDSDSEPDPEPDHDNPYSTLSNNETNSLFRSRFQLRSSREASNYDFQRKAVTALIRGRHLFAVECPWFLCLSAPWPAIYSYSVTSAVISVPPGPGGRYDRGNYRRSRLPAAASRPSQPRRVCRRCAAAVFCRQLSRRFSHRRPPVRPVSPYNRGETMAAVMVANPFCREAVMAIIGRFGIWRVVLCRLNSLRLAGWGKGPGHLLRMVRPSRRAAVVGESLFVCLLA